MTRQRYVSLVLILGLLSAIGPFSIDMYLPGFRDIARNLNTSVASVAFSVSSYFIGISVGQLLYGPLLDRYGRKKPLYAGLLIYMLATITCLRVTTIDQLVVIRFVQAVGSCGAGVASIAMVRDLFDVKESAKVFSLLLLVIGASPMIAPTAGGYVISMFGWRAVFVILLIMSILITLLTIFWLPESHKPDKTLSLAPGPITKSFITVLKQPQFLAYAVSGSFAFATLFIYVSGSPIVFMDIFHVDKKVYGWIFAFLSIGFIGLSQFNTLLLRRFSSEQVIWTALTLQVIIGSLFLMGSMSGWLNLPLVIGFLFLLLGCVGFIYPNTAALSMAPFSSNAGSASAMLGALQMGIGALASVAVGMFSNGTITPMITIMVATSAIAVFILLASGRRLKSNAAPVTHSPQVPH